MNHEISTLKDQGVADHDLVELLILKGKKEDEILNSLTDFYKSKNATEVNLKNAKTNNILLIIITVLLAIIAGGLGYFIFQSA